MSESNFELPQLSMARYVDLLKRRRWQVVPVSLLGLLIGGAVAFFVPRYYVAETRVDYYRIPSEVQVSPHEDPFKFVVDNAVLMLPQAAAATMQRLGWPESREPDLVRRRELEREVEQRVNVYDVNPDRNRTYAQIVVSYRDRDGMRAAEFLNELVRMWMEQRLTEMRSRADRQNVAANQEMRTALDEYTRINADLTQLDLQYGFSRLKSEAVQHEEQRQRADLLARRAEKLDGLEHEIAGLQQRIEMQQRRIDTTRRTLDPSSLSLADRFKPDSEEARQFAELRVWQSGLELMGTAYPGRAEAEQKVKMLREKFATLLADVGETANPELLQRREQLEEAQVALKAAERSRDLLRTEIATETERAQRRSLAEQQYVAKQRASLEAEDKRKAATQKLALATEAQARLDSEPPLKQAFQALMPKRPTEPNILLVAVLGCVVGLGAAIVLVLLLDLLKGTFKTLDDVERGLPVPVLGGVSHFETPEERRRVSHGRRRASLVAGLLLAGGVLVVTAYYVAPHRLPEIARNLLSMVLGG